MSAAQTDEELSVVRVFLTRENAGERMLEVHDGIDRFIDDGARVEIKPKTETRRDIQNRLLFRWLGQIAKHNGNTQSYEFGRSKLEQLHPLKLADDREHERAVLEEAMIDGAVAMVFSRGLAANSTARELRIEAAIETVRSKTIRARLFAAWLTVIQQEAAEQGIVLQSREDEREAALFEQHDQARTA